LDSTKPNIFESIQGLKDDFTQLLLLALKEGLLVVSEAKNSGKHIGCYHDFPSLSFNKNGLPRLSSTFSNEPIKYRNYLTTYSEIPRTNKHKLHSFNELVAFVKSNEVLCKRFTPTTKKLKAEKKRQLMILYIHLIAEDCIERYIYQFNEFKYDEEKALVSVAPTISYIFNKNLNIDISVPILFSNFQCDSYQLADGIYIERIPELQHKARYKIQSNNTSTHQDVINSATHALVLKEYFVPNSEQMYGSNVLSQARAYPIDLINQFFGALRICSSIDTGYTQIYAVAKGWAAHCTTDLPYLEGALVKSYPSWFENYYWDTEEVPVITDEELEKTKNIFNQILSTKENSIDLALKRLNRCYIRDDEEDAVLDATIALEALLLDGNQEMTHKLAMRVGALSQLDDKIHKNPFQAFQDVKSIYAHRSAIVHGSKTPDKKRIVKITEEKSTTTHILAIDYLRMILRVLLKNKQYRKPKQIDETLLLGSTNNR